MVEKASHYRRSGGSASDFTVEVAPEMTRHDGIDNSISEPRVQTENRSGTRVEAERSFHDHAPPIVLLATYSP